MFSVYITLKRVSVKRAAATEMADASIASRTATVGMVLLVLLLTLRRSPSLATMMEATMQRAPIYCNREMLRWRMN